MSRTDKDRPYWVRGAEIGIEPFHMCWSYSSRSWQRRGECDLPPAPPLNKENFGSWRVESKTRCHWTVCVPPDGYSQTRGVRKKAYRRAYFHGPQRAGVRLAAREAIMGNHEVEFPDGRTRHSVLWDMS